MYETNEYDIPELDYDPLETECNVWRVIGVPRNVYELDTMGEHYNAVLD